jgi:microcystin-dependent protein
LLIPNGIDWLAIVAGCLEQLTASYNFEQFGTATPSQTSDAFRIMADDFALPGDRSCRVIGEIIPYAGNTSPNANWLLCDGGPLLRNSYPDLFAVIGTNYGASDSSHFNLPDLRSRVALGIGTGPGLSTYALGDAGGQEAHTLTAAEMPSHSHTDAGHVHGESVAAPFTALAPPAGVFIQAIPAAGITGVGNANIQNSGGGGAHENRQPYLAINYLIVALE